jgi:hypothetical protein
MKIVLCLSLEGKDDDTENITDPGSKHTSVMEPHFLKIEKKILMCADGAVR